MKPPKKVTQNNITFTLVNVEGNVGTYICKKYVSTVHGNFDIDFVLKTKLVTKETNTYNNITIYVKLYEYIRKINSLPENEAIESLAAMQKQFLKIKEELESERDAKKELELEIKQKENISMLKRVSNFATKAIYSFIFITYLTSCVNSRDLGGCSGNKKMNYYQGQLSKKFRS